MGKKHSKKSLHEGISVNKNNEENVGTVTNMVPPLLHSVPICALEGFNDVLLCGDSEGMLLKYGLLHKQLQKKVKIHNRGITKVQHDKTNKDQCFTSSRDKTIKYYNVLSESTLQSFTGHTMAVTALSHTTDYSQLVSGSRDCTVKLWNVETGCNIKTNTTARNIVTDLKVAENNQMIVQCAEDKLMKLLDTRDLKTTSTFPLKQHFQTCCDMNSTSNHILTGSTGYNGNGCEVTIWDVRQLNALQIMKGHTEKITACKFLSNSSCAVTVSHDCSIKIWDTQTGGLVASHTIGGAKELTSLAINENGKIFVGTFTGNIHCFEFCGNNLEQKF